MRIDLSEVKGRIEIPYGIFRCRCQGREVPMDELPSALENFRREYGRELYKTFGQDPTKFRPSSEALHRRLSRGKPFPKIHPAVDAINLLSLINSIPYGLYDFSKIRGNIKIRLGKSGEGYRGIGRDWINLEGRLLLEDGEGPFGNPTGDSFRTAVDQGTETFLYVIFAPPGYPSEEANLLTMDRLKKWLEAEIIEYGLRR